MAISGGVIWAVTAAILTSVIIGACVNGCLQINRRVLLVVLLSVCVVGVCGWIHYIMFDQSVLVFKGLYIYFDEQKTRKPKSKATEEEANENES